MSVDESNIELDVRGELEVERSRKFQQCCFKSTRTTFYHQFINITKQASVTDFHDIMLEDGE